MAAIKRFVNELQRRKVPTAMLAYAAGGWVVMEVSSIVLPAFLLPDWSLRLVVIMVIMGFPLAIVVAWFFDITARGFIRTSDLPEADSGTVSAATTIEQPPSGEGAIASVSVLPFESLSPDSKHEPLAEGLATEIHSTLGQMHEVRVASRRSAFRFRDGTKSLQEIAEALNVRYILSGSLMCSNNKIRVFAELDDAHTGSQIWAQKFERTMDDLLSIQAEIAEAIVGAFGIERERTEIKQVQSRPTENLDAWELVQKARNYILDYSESSLNEARALLEASIKLDPDYAAAHAALGSVLMEQTLSGFSDQIPDDRIAAVKAVTKAQELAPKDHFVLKMVGMVQAICGHPNQSLEALRSCVKLAPFDFGAWGYYGWALTARAEPGDLKELHQIIDRLFQVAPTHPGTPFWLYHKSVACTLQGDLQQAEELMQQAAAQHQPIPWAYLHMANIQGLLGNPTEAALMADRAVKLNPKMTPTHYAECIQAMSEDNNSAQSRLQGLTAAGLLELMEDS